MYQRLDGNDWQHIWVVSDLHGCYDALMAALKARRFNPYADLLISVGDLIDRGPDSLRCLALLHEKWFRAVRGNHEQMALDALATNDFSLWRLNGGSWFSRLESAQKEEAATALLACANLPLILEIRCTNGLNVIAHADYPSSTYQWQKPVSSERVLWDRDRLMGFMVGKGQNIAGADHFWFGHTPLDKRYDFPPLHYIDTGAVFDGYLTLAQLQ